MNWPGELSGTHPLASWCNKLLRASKASRLATGAGYAPYVTTEGTVLKLESPAVVNRPWRIVRSSTWLKYQVRPGLVITTGDLITPSNTNTDITLTSGVAKFWIYLDMTSTTAAVASSSTLPTFAVDKIPIGYVDTSTDSGTSQSTAYQILDTHIFNPCLE